MLRRLLLIILFGFAIFASAQTDRKYIQDGNRMYHKQNYVQAEVLYRKAISKNPENPQAVYNLGCALMMQNKDSAAIVQYQNATKLEKNKKRLYGMYHNIGVICQNHKMYGEAIMAYQQALRNNPKDHETRYNLALCKRLQKKQQNNKNKDKEKKNDKSQEDNKGKDNKPDKDKDENKQSEQEEQMSKDNAEQLLNAAMQNEKATQQRMMKDMRKSSGSRRLQKNW